MEKILRDYLRSPPESDWFNFRNSLKPEEEEFEFIFKNRSINVELYSSKDPIYPTKLFCKYLKFSKSS